MLLEIFLLSLFVSTGLEDLSVGIDELIVLKRFLGYRKLKTDELP